VERAAEEMKALLEEAYRIMPLGTRFRAEWIERCGELLEGLKGGATA
jgi:hypothetical protein